MCASAAKFLRDYEPGLKDFGDVLLLYRYGLVLIKKTRGAGGDVENLIQRGPSH
jgi:hypothetical protein